MFVLLPSWYLICIMLLSHHNVEAMRHQKFFGELASGLLQGMLGAPTPVQSPEAMRETNMYAAMKLQQDTSRSTRLLEDHLISLQDEIRNLDKATEEERRAIAMRIQQYKSQLITVIARTSKILRVAYLMAYPDKKNSPIIIVPKDTTDDETAKAFEMFKKGQEDLEAGKATRCATLAETVLAVQKERRSAADEFREKADRLATASLKDRLKIDEAGVLYWKRKASDVQSLLREDENVAAKTAAKTSQAAPSKMSGYLSNALKQTGNSLLSTGRLPQPVAAL